MVKRLHAAGLEVILDVVFNHTAEGGYGGPTLCHRGIDNPTYYRLSPADPRYYVDTTGTGNSLNVDHATTLRLIMDSLRYWILEMHVDGFRFDLATTLAREDGSFERTASFFDLITQDPVVGRTKLIAEPWDVGQMDSYSLGRFPPLWSEWNGRYRDSVRDFWRGTDGMLGELATRLSGSSDLFGGSVRRPSASVNLVTVHDGFTLRDLVSYDQKHNEANGEQNRDGSTDNRSWNSGAEGRDRRPGASTPCAGLRTRAILTTLLTSLGAPLLLGGDELGRTQDGNNNAYSQDGPMTWVDWENADQTLLAFTQRLDRPAPGHPVLRRRRFLTGAQTEEIGWYSPTGRSMTSSDWSDPRARSRRGVPRRLGRPRPRRPGRPAGRHRPAPAGERLVRRRGVHAPGRAPGQHLDHRARLVQPDRRPGRHDVAHRRCRRVGARLVGRRPDESRRPSR